MSFTTALVGIVVIVLVYYVIRQRKAAPDQRPDSSRPTRKALPTTFHAVSIAFEPTACLAAKSLDGKRFLSDAAPQIPLAQCDAPDCQCRFEHHQDRREADDDRRNPYKPGIAGETGEFKTEQRLGPRDRRDIEPPKKI